MLGKYFSREFFQDRTLAILSGSILVWMGIDLTQILLSVQNFSVKIPVRYSEYGRDSYKLGDWFSQYDLAFFVVASSLFSIFLALRFFKINRMLALTVLVMHHVILVFFFLVANAILSTSPVTS